MTRGLMVAGHQPNFLPWFGFFEKMLKCDIFVLSDDVQYAKHGPTNRVEIPVNGSPWLLTLPVRRGNDASIRDKRFLRDPAELRRILRSLEVNLGALPHASDAAPLLDALAKAWERHETVAGLNIEVNMEIASALGITTPIRLGSELGLGAFRSNERLIARCRTLGCTRYLCGQGAEGYQDPALIAAAGIELVRIRYDLGERLLGGHLRYSVLAAIAAVGLEPLRRGIAEWKSTRTAA